jgi:membrane-associated protease RseP (regulator of RpoE activity)
MIETPDDEVKQGGSSLKDAPEISSTGKTGRPHPEVIEHRQKLLTSIMAVIVLAWSLIVLFLIFGQPLLGNLMLTTAALVVLGVSYFVLLMFSANLYKSASDVGMILPEFQNSAVTAIMDVRIALKENDVESYHGNLLMPSEQAFANLQRSTQQEGILASLQPDDKFEAQAILIPKQKRTDLKKRQTNTPLHVALFLITVVTTTIAGALHEGVNLLVHPEQFSLGLPYSLSLMAILGLHELGHYAVGRYHKMDVTPPYFLPAPFALGTFGAFISMRSPSVNRKVMFDTAFSGPFLGFVLSLVFLVIGLRTVEVGTHIFNTPLLSPNVGSSILFTLIASVVNPGLPYGASLDLNAFAFAGWLGLLVTAINLIPAGQLDGGHIVQAMLGPKSGNAVSTMAVIALLLTALFIWPSLLLFALLVLLLVGRSAPALDGISPIGIWRTAAGVSAMICLFLILLPLPIEIYSRFFN